VVRACPLVSVALAIGLIASLAAALAPGSGALAQATPVAARQVGSPVAADRSPCGDPRASARDVADAFLAAAVARDLDAARPCLPPDRRPDGWGDVPGLDERDDLAKCQGVDVSATEAELESIVAVAYRFAAPCATADLDAWQEEAFDAETLPTDWVVVQLDRLGGRWFVLDCFLLVED